MYHYRVCLLIPLFQAAIDPSITYIIRNTPKPLKFSLNIDFFDNDATEGIGKHYKTTRAGKTETISQIKSYLSKSMVVLQINTRKFKVSDREKINDTLKEFAKENNQGDEPRLVIQMVKNSLMSIALKGTVFEPLTPNLTGTNLYLFIYNDEIMPNVISLLLRLRRADKDVRKHTTMTYATYSNTLLKGPEIQALHALPSKQQLLSQMLSLLNSTAQNVASAIDSIPTSLAIALSQIDEK